MNVRQLRLVITATANTHGAFGDVQRQLQSIQYQVGFFNRFAISVPHVVNAAISGFGSAIAHGITQFSRLGYAFGMVFENKSFGAQRALADLKRQFREFDAEERRQERLRRAAIARKDYTQAGIHAGLRSAAGASALALIPQISSGILSVDKLQRLAQLGGTLQGIFQGVGEVIGSLFGVLGAFASAAVQVIQMVIQAAIRLAQTVGGFLYNSFIRLSIAAGIAGAAMLGAFAVIGKAGLDFNSFKEQTIIAFEVLFRSTDTAVRKFDFLKRFADWTPFDTKEVINAGKTLASYGLEVERFITVAGNMASAFNKPLQDAVELLARAKAGIFASREFAPLGITRDRLRTVGYQFKKSGEPVDRANLLDAVTRVVERDFGGMMQRQALTSSGLTSTLLAFFTEDLPAAVTEGLDRARKSILFFMVQFMHMLRASGQLDKMTAAFGKIFDVIGTLALWVAAKIPEMIGAFDKLVETGKWDNFLRIVWAVFLNLFNLIIQGLTWVQNNWTKIWAIIGIATINTVKVVGGVIAGMVNVFDEMILQNDNVGESFKKLAMKMGDWAYTTVDGVFNLIKALFILQIAVSGVILVLGILAKSPAAIAMGAAGVAVGSLGFAAANWGQGKTLDAIKNFDYEKISKDFQAQGKKPGVVGAFVRGYQNWGKTVDKFVKNVGEGADLPPPPPAAPQMPSPGRAGGYFGPDEEELYNQAVKKMEEHVNMLEAGVSAWKDIFSAAKLYGDLMLDANAAMQMQLHAALGLLGAHVQLRDGQMQMLRTQEAGTEAWWKTLGALNSNVEAMGKMRDEIRKILFDAERINAQIDFGDKLLKLGKEAGFGGADMAGLVQGQFKVLTDSLMLERGRLATMEQGTAEWHKQRSTIVDIISKIVELRKQLDDSNEKITEPKLMTPSGQYGMRGPAFGPEWVKFKNDSSAMAGSIKQLLDLSLNPNPVNLDELARQYGGNIPGSPAELQQQGVIQTARIFAEANAIALAPLFGGTTPAGPNMPGANMPGGGVGAGGGAVMPGGIGGTAGAGAGAMMPGGTAPPHIWPTQTRQPSSVSRPWQSGAPLGGPWDFWDRSRRANQEQGIYGMGGGGTGATGGFAYPAGTYGQPGAGGAGYYYPPGRGGGGPSYPDANAPAPNYAPQWFGTPGWRGTSRTSGSMGSAGGGYITEQTRLASADFGGQGLGLRSFTNRWVDDLWRTVTLNAPSGGQMTPPGYGGGGTPEWAPSGGMMGPPGYGTPGSPLPKSPGRQAQKWWERFRNFQAPGSIGGYAPLPKLPQLQIGQYQTEPTAPPPPNWIPPGQPNRRMPMPNATISRTDLTNFVRGTGSQFGPPTSAMNQPPPPHIWPTQPKRPSSVTIPWQTGAPLGGPFDFWKESLDYNAELGIRGPTPQMGAGTIPGRGSIYGGGAPVNINIGMVNEFNGEVDEQRIRSEAQKVFDQKLNEALEEFRRMKGR